MFEITIDELANRLSKGTSSLAFVLSSNYEPRSVLGVEALVNAIDTTEAKTKVAIIHLRAESERSEPLSFLKQANSETLMNILRNARIFPDIENFDVGYPQLNDDQILNVLTEVVIDLPSPVSLIIDVSALPRRLIIAMMRKIASLANSNPIAQLYFLYSWPRAYSQPRYPAEVGGLRTTLHPDSIEHVFSRTERTKRADVGVLLGRHGFQAHALIDALPRDRQVDFYIFMNRDNPFHSLEVTRANFAVLSQRSQTIHYYLTCKSGHEKLMDWSRKCEIAPNTAYLLAPWGPKPLTISAYLAVNRVQARSQGTRRVLADIVLFTADHYLNTYSIGFSHLSAYSLNIDEISRNVP